MKSLVNIIVIVLSLLLSPFLELSAQVDPFESPTPPKKAPAPSVNPFIKPTTKASEPSAKGDGMENAGQTLPLPKPPPPVRKQIKRDGSANYPFKLGQWEIIIIPLEDLEDKIPTLGHGYEPFGVYANKIFLKRKTNPIPARGLVIPPRRKP